MVLDGNFAMQIQIYMKNFLFTCILFCSVLAMAQTKVGGKVIDEAGEPVAFANVIFKNSTEGTTTDDNGNFYMESDSSYETLEISFLGYETQDVLLKSKVTYNMRITLLEGSQQLKEVVIYAGKRSKKNNPAIDILRKIWSKKSRVRFEYD